MSKEIREERAKFATQVDRSLLEKVKKLAHAEGRQIQSLMDEALEDLLEKRRTGRARTHVMDAYQKSHERFASLYEELAK